jgi:hypothetical protein
MSRLDITDESFIAVCPAADGQPPLFGQVQHFIGDRSARLTYILPGIPEPHPALPALLDELAARAGEMGATNLLAEINDGDASLEVLRKGAFSIYGWETIWKLPRKAPTDLGAPHLWEPMTAVDEPAVRSLYQTLVPPLVQTAEPYPGPDVRRLIYRNNGEMVAYVESSGGAKGIYLKPIIHPAAELPQELLAELIKLFQGLDRPVYLQMRSYQAWLSPFLDELNAGTSLHFALMVRRLAVPQYAPAAAQRLRLEHRQTETSATIVQKMAAHRK